MASLSEEKNLKVSILSTTENNDHTTYNIVVTIGEIHWTVSHRYSDFQLLHQKLTANHGLAKHLLPPKKIIGNKEKSFIEKRKLDLEAYLQGVVAFMQQAIVEELADFLNLASYEVLYLRQKLAMSASNNSFSEESLEATLSTLELHAISHGLDHAKPSHTPSSFNRDFTHVAEVATHIRRLTVIGSWNAWMMSNIIPNELEFNFNLFKKVLTLIFKNANVLKINNASTIRKTLDKLYAINCGLKHVSDILLCDSEHRDVNDCDKELLSAMPRWEQLKDLNLSNNEISSIDLSISLCNRLETVDLSGNRLTSLNYLTKLPYLISVVVSNNAIVEVPDLHIKLGNLVHLDLSRNMISSLKGLSCLYSLGSLDVSCNAIIDVQEVLYISKLPCLENFVLTGNPVSTIIDYRTKVLEFFGDRYPEICLDNERSTQRELDKVAVLQALSAARRSREGHKLPPLSLLGPITMPRDVLTIPAPDVATAADEATTFD